MVLQYTYTLKLIQFCIYRHVRYVGRMQSESNLPENTSIQGVRLFLVGDVMLGRGVDQILDHHVDPILYEDYVKNARDYVALAEEVNGALPKLRSTGYIWGDAAQILENFQPHARIINLETAVTTCDEPWPRKGIHYRMHPRNVEVLQAVGIQCTVLANNHVLDWHYNGLKETLNTLRAVNIACAGAGLNAGEAQQPAVLHVEHPAARILVFAYGHPSSGVPKSWQAGSSRPGVNYLRGEFDKNLADITSLVARHKTGPNDIAVFSVHWGSNWDWDLEEGVQAFARKLIDQAGIDLIHGHSSHHIKGVEVYRGKLIIYGAGDFLSDYEGITGGAMQMGFRDDVSFMYFPDVNAESGRLNELLLVPMRLKSMRVNYANEPPDLDWLFKNMRRECRRLGTDIIRHHHGYFKLRF